MGTARISRAFGAVAGLAIGLIGVASDAQSPGVGSSPASRVDGLIWRISNRCAQNCIYMILKLRGESVPYYDVERKLPIVGEGTTLVAVRDCLRSFGLAAHIVRGGPDALARANVPLIAHWDEEGNRVGHYVVIIGSDANGVRYLDGTTASISWLPMPEFQKKWSGYLVTLHNDAWWRPLPQVAIALGSLSIVLAIWGKLRFNRDLAGSG
jgi:ABC-type bacteriocin/lantibiotic exporter with double-glycine peptidase domain